ncbi:MAG: N-acetylmuramoyl-L-alanine amidase [Clostridia bacterium]|nr:N-acetylmuramoyl-L-alanine amidase [Clostridia bacterium]
MRVYVFNGRRLMRGMRAVLLTVVGVLVVTLMLRLASRVSADKVYEDAFAESKQVIVIDAGHGGEDPGAVGISGVYEKDLNLEIAMLIGEELKSRGYEVVYTRTEDKLLYSEEENIKGLRKLSDLKNRCRISEEAEAALFISVHMNSYGDPKYSGLQVYYTDGSNDSRSLATTIQNAVRDNVQADNDRVVKSGKNLYLLENCSGVGVLVECGFITNAEECEKLSQKEYQKQLSFAIVCGIIEYIEEK